MSLMKTFERWARDLSPTMLTRKEEMLDISDLIEMEQKHWAPRMRKIKGLGEPVAGLGFAGLAVPNNEVVATPAAVTSTSETCLYTLASTGPSTWMWIPAGNFRAPQSWIVFASGVFTTAAASQTFTWTTRLGTSTTAGSNASIGATGAMVPSTGGAIAGGFWSYLANLAVRTPGTAGTALATETITMASAASSTASVTAVSGITAAATLDCTQGALWCIDVAVSTTTASTQLTQMLILAAD